MMLVFSRAVADVGDVVWVAGPEVLSVLEAAQKKAVKDFGEREGVAIAGLIEGHGFFLAACGASPDSSAQELDVIHRSHS